MNKTLKWILGIVAVVILVGAMFAIGFAWRSHMAYGWDEVRQFDGQWSHPMMRDDWNQRGDWNHPMVMTRRFSPYDGFSPLGGIVHLALFAGLLYGAYWLGRRNARITLDPSTGSGQRPAPSAPVEAPAPLKTPEQDS